MRAVQVETPGGAVVIERKKGKTRHVDLLKNKNKIIRGLFLVLYLKGDI